jgi:2-iminobutanoate/2-iminopropanoate deaminase
MSTPSTTTGRRSITAAGAPPAVGPYTHAVLHRDPLYCSGALPVDPGTGAVAGETLAAETKQCLRNLAAVCEEAGTSLDQALRLTIYTTRLDGFAEINEAYGAFFAAEPPARVSVGVVALPRDVRVEIDAVVAVS